MTEPVSVLTVERKIARTKRALEDFSSADTRNEMRESYIRLVSECERLLTLAASLMVLDDD